MAENVALRLNQANDETLHGTVLDEATKEPVDLTGVTLTMLIKPTRQTVDDDPGVVTLTPDVAAPETGAYTVDIPAAALTAAGRRWYRIDALSAGRTRTVVYGPLNVRDL